MPEVSFTDLIAPRAREVAERTTSALAGSVPRRGETIFPREKQDWAALRDAIGLALDELYTTELDREAMMAVDESFLTHPKTVELLWKRLLSPSGRDEQFDYDVLAATFLVSWPSAERRTAGWESIRAVVVALVDLLCDKVVRGLPRFRVKISSTLPGHLDSIHPIPARMMLNLAATSEAPRPVSGRLDLFQRFMPEYPSGSDDRNSGEWLFRYEDLRSLRRLAFGTLCRNQLGRFPFRAGISALGRERFGTAVQQPFVQRFLEYKDDIAFQPAAVQSYLAAGILRKLCSAGGVSSIRQYLFHPNWEDVIVLLAGDLSRELLENLCDMLLHPAGSLRLGLYHDHLRLVAACLHETAYTGLTAEGLLEKEVERLLQEDNDAAFDVLANWGRGIAPQRTIVILRSGVLPASGKMLCALKRARPGLKVTAVAGLEGRFHISLTAGDLDSVFASGMFHRYPPLQSPPSNASGYVEPSALLVDVWTETEDPATVTIPLPAVEHDYVSGWDEDIGEYQRLALEDSVFAVKRALASETGDATYRVLAAGRLGAIGSDEPDLATSALLKALRDTDAFVRRAAAASLEAIALRSGAAERANIIEQLVVLLDDKACVASRADIIRAIRTIDRSLRAEVEPGLPSGDPESLREILHP